MATKSDDLPQNERIREVIRLLKLALDDCYRFLGENEEAVRQSKQDNDPLR